MKKKKNGETDVRTVSLQIPNKLYWAFKAKLAKDKAKVRQVLWAMLELYVQGGLSIEKGDEVHEADQK